MQRLLDKTRAVVDIRVTGAYPEDLINRLAAKSVAFWNLRKEDALCWHLSMYASDYKKIRHMAKRAMCRTRVTGRHGFPFFARKMKKRKLLLAGLALCVLAALILPMFVWTYTVEGNETVPDEQILRALDEIGVGVGTFGLSIRPVQVKNKMLLKIPELAWLTVNVSGGRATVIVREEIPKPEILDENIITDLVAVNTGIITRMEVLRGMSLVKVGQTVLKGEKLVSGAVEHYIFDKFAFIRTVRSMGEVYARTWRKMTAQMPLDMTEKSYTGEKTEKYALIIGEKRINFFIDGSNSYDKCDKLVERKWLTLPGGYTFPIGLETETASEYAPVSGQVSQEAAKAMLEAYLLEAVKSQMVGGAIKSSEFTSEVVNGVLKVSVLCECEEQIATEVVSTVPGLTPGQ